MKTWTLNGEQTLFESLEADFGAHMYISSNQVMWSGTETITLSTDATLSADDTQRTAQMTNLKRFAFDLNRHSPTFV